MPNRKPSKPVKNKQMKKKEQRKYSKRMGGRGGQDDDDYDSVDSNGNLRDLIDYGSEEPSLEETDSESLTPPSVPPATSSRLPRKAAVEARKKIQKMAEEEEREQKQREKQEKHDAKLLEKLYAQSLAEAEAEEKQTREKKKKKLRNEIIYPKKGPRKLTPSKRPCPFSSRKKSNKRQSPVSTTSSSSHTTETSVATETTTEVESEHDSSLTEDETEYSDESDPSEDITLMEEDSDGTDTDGVVEEEDDDSTRGMGAGISNIILAFGGPPGGGHQVPKKHNMKKESAIVQKFVKLLTAPLEDNGIDTQITQFKALSQEKQNELIYALEHRPTVCDTGINLMLKILTLKVSPEVQGMILSKYNGLQNLDNSSGEYHKVRNWLDKAVSIPFGIYKEVPARLDDGPERCGEFMKGAKKYLDDAVFGQEESKLQIMQFIGTKIANPEGRGQSLLFIGEPGVGKTTIIKNGIAKALGWPFQFISLGGDSDASTYTGHQLVYESSHCGKIVNSLIASKSMSTVLMFDEVDKISQTPKGEEVMNLLIHLTDPVQNSDFEDKYLAGIPIDLSKVMFVFSANDITKIDRVLLDRMTVVNLQGYDLKQKIVIAEQYILPAALKEVNLTERIHISKEVLAAIITEYASDDKGIRELKRCIEQITQKINMLRMYNSPDLPFHIKDFSLPFIVKKEHIKLFLKKKENRNAPPPGWYI